MSSMNLRMLPKTRDSWSFVYVERCRVDREGKSISVHDLNGKTALPCATLTLLLLGPGTTITHAAVKTLADHGCSVLWTGEGGVRMYAQGLGETRSAKRLLHQVQLYSDPAARLAVVRRMYEFRFEETLDPGLTLRQIRGKEGMRVRQAYAQASADSGVPWRGRAYMRDDWHSADPVNRALSAANSCLYGVCHAAIVAAGYAPGLGFIHTGKLLSFVYDIADLYKARITIPAAFRGVQDGEQNMESRVRREMRDLFRSQRILKTIVDDIDTVLRVHSDDSVSPYDEDSAAPGLLWNLDDDEVAGGQNWGAV